MLFALQHIFGMTELRQQRSIGTESIGSNMIGE
jgi:hypothetical protein